MIEKHFTLDRSMLGPDHEASVNPQDFKALVDSIRSAEAALGDATKAPQSSELSNKELVRKSFYAARSIAAGKQFDEDDLTLLRPRLVFPHLNIGVCSIQRRQKTTKRGT